MTIFFHQLLFRWVIAFLAVYITSEKLIKIDEEFTSDNFTINSTDKQGWSFDATGFQPVVTSYYYDCGIQQNHRLFGGYLVFRGSGSGSPKPTKTFSNLLPHYQIQINVKIFKIDSWNTENVYVYVDGVTRFTGSYDCCFNGTDFCGSILPPTTTSLKQSNPSYQDGIQNVAINVTHSATSAKIQLWSNINHDENESWGFREFYLYIYTCNETCFQCSFGFESADKCTQCFAGSSLTTITGGQTCRCNSTHFMDLTIVCILQTCNKCVSSCPIGYYGYNADRLCYHCKTECLQCTSNEVCTICAIGYYLNSINATCLKCEQPCLNCFMDSTNCTSCIANYFLNSSGLLQTCDSCSSFCKICLNNTGCTTCITKYYVNTTTNTCLLCGNNCDICNSTTPTTCYSCSPGYFLNSSTCFAICPSPFWGDLVERICIPECQTGYYSSDYGRVCRFCDDVTVRCFGGRAKDSIECQQGYFLYLKECVQQCPAGSFSDVSTKTCNQQTMTNVTGASYQCKVSCQFGYYYNYSAWGCLPCQNPCAACDILIKTKCLTCFPPYFLTNYTCILQTTCLNQSGLPDLSNQLCLSNISEQQPCTYFDNSTSVFRACHATCCNQTCYNDQPCCPVMTYYDNFTQSCENCHPSCQNCIGFATNCLACIQPPASFFRTDNAVVDGSCPCIPGFVDIWQPSCAICHYTCVECNALGGQNCTVCPPITTNRTDLSAPSGGSCPCFQHYGDNPLLQTVNCAPCHYTCQKCIGEGPNNCSQCNASVLTNRTDHSNATIGGSCPCQPGFYDDGSNIECQPCHYTCMTCISNSYKNCTVCSSMANRILLELLPTPQGECQCVDGFYDNNIPQCQPCYYACKTCLNTGISECTQCPSALSTFRIDNIDQLVTFKGSCDCPAQFYFDDSAGQKKICQKCHYTCKSCVGIEVPKLSFLSYFCLTCPDNSNRQFNATPANSTLGSCPCLPGFYDLGLGWIPCFICNPVCLTCQTGQALLCDSCDPDPLIHRINDSSLNCPCESGFYDVGAPACASCDSTCGGGNCSFTASNCTSCPNIAQLHRMDNSSYNSCPCEDGWFDCGSTACCQCSPLCVTCAGGSNPQNCTSCDISQNLALDPLTSTCICAPAFYLDPTTSVCTTCANSCQSCNGSSNISCTSCPSQQDIYHRVDQSNTTGQCPCLIGFYDNGINQICQPCSQFCLGCTSSSNTSCTTCNATQYRQLDNTTSQCVCINTYYEAVPQQQECLPCYYTCLTCTAQSTSLNQCTSCDPTQYRNASFANGSFGSCDCQPGYIALVGQTNCSQCQSPCSTCSIVETNCTSCVSSFWMNGVSCEPCDYYCDSCNGSASACATCPIGSYRDSSNNCACQYHYFEVSALQNPICSECNRICGNCFDELENSCTTCPPNSNRVPIPDSAGACPCLTGYREINLTACSNCHSSCDNCTNSSLGDVTSCLSCNDPSRQLLILDNVTNAGRCICITGFIEQIDGQCVNSTLITPILNNNGLCQQGFYKRNVTNTNLNDTCKPCFYTCEQCVGSNYDQCTKCLKDRGTQLSSVVGTCTCANDDEDESDSGICISSSSIVGMKQSTVGLMSSTATIGLLVAIVNKKLMLSFRFLDVAQQLGYLYMINVHYPGNMEKIFEVLYYTNFHQFMPNVFKISAQKTGLLTYSDEDKYQLENQNSYTKYRLANLTSSFLINSGGAIELILFSWVSVFLFRMLASRLKEPKKAYAKRILEAIDVSLPLQMLFLTSGDFFLHFLIQLAKPSFENSFNGFSYMGSLVFMGWCAFYLFIVIRQLKKTQSSEIKGNIHLLQKYACVFLNISLPDNTSCSDGCIRNLKIVAVSPLAKYWFFIIMAKKAAISSFTFICYSNPQVQVIVLMIIQAFFSILQFKYNPYNLKYLRILTNVSEGLQLLIYIGILSHVVNQGQFKPNFTGIWMAIVLVILLLAVHFIFMLGNFIIELPLFKANLKVFFSRKPIKLSRLQNSEYPHTLSLEEEDHISSL